MGILDDAIKEHLELKRQHGAEASELKQLEDEAFGAAERPGDESLAPDPLAEAPTEFMQRPEGLDAEDEPGRSPRTELADLQEPPPAPEVEEGEEAEAPAEEESPAIEHEAVPEPTPEPDAEPEPEPDPEPPSSHTTAEREAIAEHPTEMYDIEAELGPGEPRASAEEAPAAPQPTAEEAPADEAPVDEEDPEDFFDEQRLSEELDQALEAPAEEDDLAEDEYDEEPGEEGEDDTPEEDAGAPEALRPPEREGEAPEALRPAEGEEDVLEETPDFLEEAPEDDRLWFEQKPPKDFDFDD